MERAEFTVDADGWKTFYKMKYDGKPERLMAFSALVGGTVHKKVGELFPAMAGALPDLKKELEPLVKEVNKAARKAAKESGVDKDYQKFARMWAARQLLMEAGVEMLPDTGGMKVKKILKMI